MCGMRRQTEENDSFICSHACVWCSDCSGRNAHLGGAAEVDTKEHAPESGSGTTAEIAPHSSSHYLTSHKKCLELLPWSFLAAGVSRQR